MKCLALLYVFKILIGADNAELSIQSIARNAAQPIEERRRMRRDANNLSEQCGIIGGMILYFILYFLFFINLLLSVIDHHSSAVVRLGLNVLKVYSI